MFKNGHALAISRSIVPKFHRKSSYPTKSNTSKFPPNPIIFHQVIALTMYLSILEQIWAKVGMLETVLA